MNFRRILLTLLALLGATQPLAPHGLGYNVEKFERSPGVYFERLGEAVLSNSEWKLVVYVALTPLTDQIAAIEQYVAHIDNICSNIDIRNWTT
jgi:hypothetical protein